MAQPTSTSASAGTARTTTSIRTITHSKSGATCQLLDYGACLLSYQTGGASRRECLFVSREAKLDGTKAVRGGIPLVFPQFGQQLELHPGMPQHGFLRINYWQVDEASLFDNEDSAGITYTLSLKDVRNDTRGSGGKLWGKEGIEEPTSPLALDCVCSYQVTIRANSFTTKLEIKNTGQQEFPLQALMHTYYFVEEQAALTGSSCYVKGLEGYSCFDKITKEESIIGTDPITIPENTLVDRVHTPPPSNNHRNDDADVVDHDLNVTVGVGPGGKCLHVTAKGVVAGKTVPVSCVVWNPNKEGASKLSDFGNEQYQDMICVEPGILSTDNMTLKSGESAVLVQVTDIDCTMKMK